jgi:hypothetical protein
MLSLHPCQRFSMVITCIVEVGTFGMIESTFISPTSNGGIGTIVGVLKFN